MDSLTTAIVAMISTFVGYLISLWRNRLRPWISLLEFSESRKERDEVEISEKLCKRSRESWFMENLPEKKGRLGEVYKAFARAKFWLRINDDSENRLKSGISQLESSKNPDDVIKALSFLLESKGISDLLEISILREEIIVNYDDTVPQQVKYYLDDKKKDGCFSFVLPTALLYFGSKLSAQPYRKEKLLPMVELISRLDKDKLTKIFKELVLLLKKQFEIHKIIVEEAEQIVNNYSRWMCKLTITNFGVTPFILFPENAELCVKGKHIKTFKLPCRVLQAEEEGWSEIKGVFVIKSGTTENLAIVTKDIQKDIEGGNILRDVYKSGDAEAFVKIQVLGREIPWKRWIKSTALVFRE